MKCKQCDYRLWALPSRQCPNCGKPFLPSEFEFVPGSVRFACPHCDQPYYGTSRVGHLEPREFTCVHCEQHVSMDEMVLFPTEGLEEDQTQPELMPWLNRKKIGGLRAWFRMIGMAMIAPGRLIRVTPVYSSVGQACWFALVTQLLFSLAGLLPLMLVPMLVFLGTRLPGAGRAAFMGPCAGVAIVPALFMVVGVGVWGLATHGLLKLTGGTEHTLGRTYHALCYSSGANVLTAVPCLGLYFWPVSPVWWIISAILMVKDSQKVHWARATIAVLVLPVITAACLIGLTVLGVSGIRRANVASKSPAFLQSVQRTETQMVTAALLSYAQSHNDKFPPHAIELVNANYVQGLQLLVWDGSTRGRTVPVGGTTLAAFEDSQFQQRQAAAARAAKSLPAAVIAHRLGDFVFTYHGIRPSRQKGKLWLVIASPTTQPSSGAPPGRFAVGCLDGTVADFPYENLLSRLSEQNQLRATFGLAPLLDPVQVTHDAPATSQPGMEPEQEER